VPEEQREAVKALLIANYRRIIAIYRAASAEGVTGKGEFGVGQLTCAEICVGAGLGNDSTTKNSDLDRLFITALSRRPPANTVVRNDKAMVRYQFTEFLLRLASQRFVQTGACQDIADGLRRVLDGLEPIALRYLEDHNLFFAALHSEPVDQVYKRHMESLRAVYKRWSGQITPPGMPKFMCPEEFQGFLEITHSFDNQFTVKRAAVAFRLGMMTQSEEMLESRFQEATFLEFCHAIGSMLFLKHKLHAGKNPSSEELASLCEEFLAKSLPLAEGQTKSTRKGSKH
jgi:hypothetical protein